VIYKKKAGLINKTPVMLVDSRRLDAYCLINDILLNSRYVKNHGNLGGGVLPLKHNNCQITIIRAFQITQFQFIPNLNL
jgi:hypothetical protein